MQPKYRHVADIALLAVACLVVRGPGLRLIALNPDECQYEATASYLAATGHSAFLLPYSSAGSMAFYKWMTVLFGPYPIWPVRVFVLLVALAMAILLCRMVGREAGRFAGLLSGIVLLYLSIPFEGLTANREWLAAPALLAGAGLALRALEREGRVRLGLLLAGGFASGAALWFKIQLSYMIFAVPLVLVWSAFVRSRPRAAVAWLLAYGAGGAAAFGLYLAQFAAAGTLGQFVQYAVTDYVAYIGANEAAQGPASAGRLALYFDRFYSGLPFRPLFAVAHVVTAATLVAAGRRLVRRGPATAAPIRTPLALTLALLALGGWIAVKMGHRFFGHYYLLAIFPVAGLIGIGFGQLRGSAARHRGALALAGTVILLVLGDRAVAASGAPSATALYGAGVGAVILVAVLARRRLAWVASCLITLEAAVLVTQVVAAPAPRSLPHHRGGFPELVGYLDAEKRQGDRLFVWGWLPEIYSLTRMEAASLLAISQYLVVDYVAQSGRGELNRPMAEQLMRDLRERRPRFIVDASARSWTMAGAPGSTVYDLGRYPDLELIGYLREGYRRVARLDDCDVYERRQLTSPEGGS